MSQPKCVPDPILKPWSFKKNVSKGLQEAKTLKRNKVLEIPSYLKVMGGGEMSLHLLFFVVQAQCSVTENFQGEKATSNRGPENWQQSSQKILTINVYVIELHVITVSHFLFS